MKSESYFELVSLALNVGEVEEDLLVVLQGLDEAESVLDGGHVSLLRGAQACALLLLPTAFGSINFSPYETEKSQTRKPFLCSFTKNVLTLTVQKLSLVPKKL